MSKCEADVSELKVYRRFATAATNPVVWEDNVHTSEFEMTDPLPADTKAYLDGLQGKPQNTKVQVQNSKIFV